MSLTFPSRPLWHPTNQLSGSLKPAFPSALSKWLPMPRAEIWPGSLMRTCLPSDLPTFPGSISKCILWAPSSPSQSCSIPPSFPALPNSISSTSPSSATCLQTKLLSHFQDPPTPTQPKTPTSNPKGTVPTIVEVVWSDLFEAYLQAAQPWLLLLPSPVSPLPRGILAGNLGRHRML